MSESPALPHLFEPLAIGPVTIRNRIVSSGHDTVMARDGKVSAFAVVDKYARAPLAEPQLQLVASEVSLLAVELRARFLRGIGGGICLRDHRGEAHGDRDHGRELFQDLSPWLYSVKYCVAV